LVRTLSCGHPLTTAIGRCGEEPLCTSSGDAGDCRT
jgi:hypothetical protein